MTPDTPFDRVVVYWFSGTGNALSGAKWALDEAHKRALSSELIPMERLSSAEVQPSSAQTLVGFCYPTHGFGPPWTVLKFFWSFPRAEGVSAFFMSSRAGWGLPGVPLPGLSGVALWLPAMIMGLKGYRVAGMLPLDMPHSWISFFPPNPSAVAETLWRRCERIVRATTREMLDGRRALRWSIFLTLPLDLAASLITPGYLILGRFVLAKTLFVATSTCNDCRLCERLCPVGAITTVDGRPYWTVHCESCMRCMSVCPRKAIQSWVSRILLFTWAVVALGGLVWPGVWWVWFNVASILVLPLYRLMHRLWGWKLVNRLFELSSMTRYWRRYLARDVRVAELPGRSAPGAEGP